MGNFHAQIASTVSALALTVACSRSCEPEQSKTEAPPRKETAAIPEASKNRPESEAFLKLLKEKQTLQENEGKRLNPTIPEQLASWRDLFVVEAKPEIKQAIESVMDKLSQHPKAKEIMEGFIERRKTELGKAVTTLEEHRQSLDQNGFSTTKDYFQHIAVAKIRIVGTDNPLVSSGVRPVDLEWVNPATGRTENLVSDALVTAPSVVIATEDQKGEYKGTDGAFYKLSLEQVLAHEVFGHLLNSNQQEQSTVDFTTDFLKKAGIKEPPRGSYIEGHYLPESFACQTPTFSLSEKIASKEGDILRLIKQGRVPPLDEEDIRRIAKTYYELCGKPEQQPEQKR